MRPDGLTELVARYAIKLDDGAQIYIDNAGIRHITDPKVAKEAAKDKIVNPKYVYFATTTKFETYDAKYKWLEKRVFIGHAVATLRGTLLTFYEVKLFCERRLGLFARLADAFNLRIWKNFKSR